MNYPQPHEASDAVANWLSEADDALECYNPDIDLRSLIEHVLGVALGSPDAEIRCEAIRVLRSGFLNHSNLRIDLRALAEKLSDMQGEELLLALNAIGASNDASLAGYVRPFLVNQDVQVRAEASETMAELGSN